MQDLKNSETLKNLLRAFAGEMKGLEPHRWNKNMN